MAADAHEEQVLGKAYDARLMRRLLGYVKPYRASAALALIYIIAASGLSVLQKTNIKNKMAAALSK